VKYVIIITMAPNRDKADVIVTSERFSVVFPMDPKPSVVGLKVLEVVVILLR